MSSSTHDGGRSNASRSLGRFAPSCKLATTRPPNFVMMRPAMRRITASSSTTTTASASTSTAIGTSAAADPVSSYLASTPLTCALGSGAAPPSSMDTATSEAARCSSPPTDGVVDGTSTSALPSVEPRGLVGVRAVPACISEPSMASSLSPSSTSAAADPRPGENAGAGMASQKCTPDRGAVSSPTGGRTTLRKPMLPPIPVATLNESARPRVDPVAPAFAAAVATEDDGVLAAESLPAAESVRCVTTTASASLATLSRVQQSAGFAALTNASTCGGS
mmetsp:Transcript_21227/g.74872  ORF Transcript_21227/g.74872 Transcript_21227/m.74872 type:complete len:278 (+) Transcript_21227:399-1232(+)